jgi:hypothetical protein
MPLWLALVTTTYALASLIATAVVLVGLVGLLMRVGRWHERPGFWRLVILLNFFSAMGHVIDHEWLGAAIAGFATAWGHWMLGEAIARPAGPEREHVGARQGRT